MTRVSGPARLVQALFVFTLAAAHSTSEAQSVSPPSRAVDSQPLRFPAGAACASNASCASGVCRWEQNRTGSLHGTCDAEGNPLNGRCSSEAAYTQCRSGGECHEGTCKRSIDAPCERSVDCASGRCFAVGAYGAADVGRCKPFGYQSTVTGPCATTAECSTSGNAGCFQKRCVFPDGIYCTTHEQCAAGICRPNENPFNDAKHCGCPPGQEAVGSPAACQPRGGIGAPCTSTAQCWSRLECAASGACAGKCMAPLSLTASQGAGSCGQEWQPCLAIAFMGTFARCAAGLRCQNVTGGAMKCLH